MVKAIIFLIWTALYLHSATFEAGLKAAKSGNYARAYTLWEPIETQTDPEVQYFLGYMFDRGYGVRRDNASAMLWYEKAALQSHAKAAFKLSMKYRSLQDRQKAVGWLTKAAELDCFRAQLMLAEMYDEGNGIAQDKHEALRWYKRADLNGFADAKEPISRLEKELAAVRLAAKKKTVKKPVDRRQAFIEQQKRLCQQLLDEDKLAWYDRVGLQKAEFVKALSLQEEKLYYPNGKKFLERRRDEQGIMHETIWYANGRVKSKVPYVNGLKDGREETWYENGARRSSVKYERGILHGDAETWYPNGKSRAQMVFANGRLTRKALVWYDNGSRAEESKFKSGYPIGRKNLWYADGKTAAEAEYLYGRLNGPFCLYYVDGHPKEKSEYLMGKLNGKRIVYDLKGKKESERLYACGQSFEGK